jgi:hypothetical protein
MLRDRRALGRPASPWQLHALGRDVVRDLERDYRAHGSRAIEDLRKNEPWSYLRLMVLLVPQQAPTAEDWFSEFSDEELDTLIGFLRDVLAEKARTAGQNET